ncbi:MAG: DUF882 domain-containing protein [Polyangiaceae bacterium]|nr:DUF882 domain-containing protein [Polyangiaceae bacterium]
MSSAGPAARRPRWRRGIALLALGAALLGGAVEASAEEIVHVVGKGSTLDGIARRYHTTIAAILRTNDLGTGNRLVPGQKLRIEIDPARFTAREREQLERRTGRARNAAVAERTKARGTGKAAADAPARGKSAGVPARAPRDADAGSRGSTRNSARADAFAAKPKRPGHVLLVRGEEQFAGQLVNARGHVVSRAVPKVEHLLRDGRSNEGSPIDHRLLSLLGRVSDHFGGRKLLVVSGFRGYSPRQFTRNSRHNHGKAVDFRVEGVPNEVLRDYCMGFEKVGVGYYPNSSFVHLDVREVKVHWTDYSGPGQAPRYARPRQPAAASRPALATPAASTTDDGANEARADLDGAE